MDSLKTYAPLIGRILLAVVFLPAAISKMSDVAAFTGFMTSGGVPAIFAWPAIIFELALGFSMLLGFQVRIMALLGALFCVVLAVLYHLVPADQIQMILFFKNLGIAGGFMMVVAHGAGAYAVDKS